MKFKAAIVGCGRIGCGFDEDPLRKVVSTHAGAYTRNSKTKLWALCDVDSKKLEKYGKKYSVFNLFTSVDELLEKAKPDLLSVCVPPNQHEEITIKASRAGVKGIFCEKPISHDPLAAKRMIKECQKNSTVLLIDHQRRFDPLISKIKSAIENGLLGQISHSVFYYTAGVYNTGTHVIDQLCYFFGEIEWVRGQLSNAKSVHENDPNIDGLLKFKNGVLVSLLALDVKNYTIFEQDIFGSCGRLKILNGGSNVEYYSVTKSKQYSGYTALERKKPPFKIPKIREPWLEGIQHMVDCIERKVKPVSSGLDGLNALEAIEALLQSSKKNFKKIELPHIKQV